MNAVLSILSDELSDEAIQKLTYEIMNTLNRETDATAGIVEAAGQAGHKGDPVTVGQITLAALTSGTVVALLKIFQVYVSQRPSLKLSLKKKGGDTVTIDAHGLSKAQYDQTLKLVKKLVGE